MLQRLTPEQVTSPITYTTPRTARALLRMMIRTCPTCKTICPPRDESHNSDQETSAGDESASESLSEKTYSSHSSQQSINYPRTTTSEPHNSIWRNEEIIDEECLSLLTPEPQWRRLFHPRRKDATLPAHQKAQSNSSQEITHNVTWHKLDQRSSSPVCPA